MLNPFKFGLFSFEVISHKLLRWLVPFFLIIIAIGSTLLALPGDSLFQGFYWLETTFFWLAITGYLKQNQQVISPIFFYPYYFLMVNYYSMIGIFKALLGNIQITWSSPRAAINENKISSKEKLIAGILFILPVFLTVYFQ